MALLLAPTQSGIFSYGLTADLLLTNPFFYWLAIRKTRIPNISVVPVFVLSMVLGFSLIPEENQQYLQLAKTWVLPVIELTVFGFIIFKIRKIMTRPWLKSTVS